MNKDDLKIAYIINTIRAAKLLIILVMSVAIITTGIVYSLTPRKYQAMSKVNLSNLALYVPENILGPEQDQKVVRNYSMIALIDFVVSDDILTEVLKETRSHKNLADIRNSVQVAKGEQDSSLTVIVIATNPDRAARTASMLAERLASHVIELDKTRHDVFAAQLKSNEADVDDIDKQIKSIKVLMDSLPKEGSQSDELILARAQAMAAFADMERTKSEKEEIRRNLDALVTSLGSTALTQKAESPQEPQGRSIWFNLLLSAIISFLAGTLIALIADYLKREAGASEVGPS